MLRLLPYSTKALYLSIQENLKSHLFDEKKVSRKRMRGGVVYPKEGRMLMKILEQIGVDHVLDGQNLQKILELTSYTYMS